MREVFEDEPSAWAIWAHLKYHIELLPGLINGVHKQSYQCSVLVHLGRLEKRSHVGQGTLNSKIADV